MFWKMFSEVDDGAGCSGGCLLDEEPIAKTIDSETESSRIVSE